jgi:hypothetical protein
LKVFDVVTTSSSAGNASPEYCTLVMTDGPRDRVRREKPLALPVVFPTFDEIARRAHELFVLEGRRLNRIRECWERAETELLNRAARRTV